jgi:hypothetical protein
MFVSMASDLQCLMFMDEVTCAGNGFFGDVLHTLALQ